MIAEAILVVTIVSNGLYHAVGSPNRSHNFQSTSIDDPRVRVREVAQLPHRSSSFPKHLTNEVLVFREAGRVSYVTDGKVEEFNVERGSVRWLTAGPAYTLESVTDAPIEIVVIELLATPEDPQVKLSNLDMLASDPQHYKLVFENEQVRILSANYGAHEKGFLHEHVRPRVIVNMNEELRAQSGDMKLGAPEVHQEQNNSDYPTQRLVVELK